MSKIFDEIDEALENKEKVTKFKLLYLDIKNEIIKNEEEYSNIENVIKEYTNPKFVYEESIMPCNIGFDCYNDFKKDIEVDSTIEIKKGYVKSCSCGTYVNGYIIGGGIKAIKNMESGLVFTLPYTVNGYDVPSTVISDFIENDEIRILGIDEEGLFTKQLIQVRNGKYYNMDMKTSNNDRYISCDEFERLVIQSSKKDLVRINREVINIGAIKSRHEMPVEEYIFEKEIVDVMDTRGIYKDVKNVFITL